MIDREDTTCRDLYLELLKKCPVNSIYEDAPAPIFINGKSTGQYSGERRSAGRDFPTKAPTMMGLHRLNNLHSLANKVLEEGIEGDFLEAKVWRGGPSDNILARVGMSLSQERDVNGERVTRCLAVILGR